MSHQGIQTGEVWLLYPLQVLLRVAARLPFPTMMRLLRLLGTVSFCVGKIPRDDWLPDGVLVDDTHALVLVQWMQEAFVLCEGGILEKHPDTPLRRRNMADWLAGRLSRYSPDEHRILLDLMGKWQESIRKSLRKDRERRGAPEPEGDREKWVDT